MNNNDAFVKAVNSVAQHLVRFASEDAGFRADLRAMVEAISVQSDRVAFDRHEESVITSDSSAFIEKRSIEPNHDQGRESTVQAFERSQATPRSGSHVAAAGNVEEPAQSYWISTRQRLGAIEIRCRLKMEAARWLASRDQRIDQGGSIEELDQEERSLLERASNLDVALWMLENATISSRSAAMIENVANAFEAVADSVALARSILPEFDGSRDYFTSALHLLAEAQSSLRLAVIRLEDRRDADQFMIYDWLRGVTLREQIYIPRFMRLNDPADPDQSLDLVARIASLQERVRKHYLRSIRKRSQFDQIRHHASRINEGVGDHRDWKTLVEATEAFYREGSAADQCEIREILTRLIDDLPADLEVTSSTFAVVIRDLQRGITAQVTER